MTGIMATACGCVVAALVMASVADAQESSRPGSLRLPKLFAHGMVVQRDVPLPVWGWAAPGAAVAVTLAGSDARGTADVSGN
ncbi:MAG TPA: hypothetical protein VFZ21_20520, partial [Gemmatimonadaceae bacterium]|nr:hypothetical protein [Gemmatimonadaceae bacterium]